MPSMYYLYPVSDGKLVTHAELPENDHSLSFVWGLPLRVNGIPFKHYDVHAHKYLGNGIWDEGRVLKLVAHDSLVEGNDTEFVLEVDNYKITFKKSGDPTEYIGVNNDPDLQRLILPIEEMYPEGQTEYIMDTLYNETGYIIVGQKSEN